MYTFSKKQVKFTAAILARVLYLTILLSLVDALLLSTFQYSLFSVCVFKSDSDFGQNKGYIGMGYYIVYYSGRDVHGPIVRYWHGPFVITATNNCFEIHKF